MNYIPSTAKQTAIQEALDKVPTTIGIDFDTISLEQPPLLLATQVAEKIQAGLDPLPAHNLNHMRLTGDNFINLLIQQGLFSDEDSIPRALIIGMVLHDVLHSGGKRGGDGDFEKNIQYALKATQVAMLSLGFSDNEILQALGIIISTTSFDSRFQPENQIEALAEMADLNAEGNIVQRIEFGIGMAIELGLMSYEEPMNWAQFSEFQIGFLDNYLKQQIKHAKTTGVDVNSFEENLSRHLQIMQLTKSNKPIKNLLSEEELEKIHSIEEILGPIT